MCYNDRCDDFKPAEELCICINCAHSEWPCEHQPDGGGCLTLVGEPDELLVSVRDFIDRYERVQAMLAELNARIEELVKEAIPGTIEWRRVSCGKANCRKCPHGPYAYLKYPSGKSKYLGKKVPEKIYKGIWAWKKLQKLRALRAEVLRKLSRVEKEMIDIKIKLTRAALLAEEILLTLGDALHEQAPGVRQEQEELNSAPGLASQEHALDMPSVQLHVQGQRGQSGQKRMCMR